MVASLVQSHRDAAVQGGPARPWLRLQTVFAWHRWLGLASGLLMLVIGTSGAIAVFKAELDWLVTPALRAPHPPAGTPRPAPAALMASLAAAYPGATIGALELAPAAGFAHRASVRPAGERARASEVFIDPVTGTVRGEREIGEGDFWSLHNFVRQFHVRLLMGAWGRVFVGVFGVVLALSCFTGLYIYRGWLRGLWRLRWRGLTASARARELHKWVGLWSLLFNLMIAGTGAVLGLENLAARIERDWLQRPAPTSPLPRASATGEARPLGELVTAAQTAFPDLALTSVTFPRRPGDPTVLRGNAGLLIARNQHYVALDPVSTEVLRVADRREAKGWDRIYLTFDPLHFGYFGGYPVKALWFLFGLTPGLLAVTGSWLWLRRRKPEGARAGSTPSPRMFLPRPLALGGAAATLLAAFVVAARAHGWDDAGVLIEHAIAKPLALALVAFPVTGLLVWLAWRATGNRFRFMCAAGLLAGWHLVLVALFQ